MVILISGEQRAAIAKYTSKHASNLWGFSVNLGCGIKCTANLKLASGSTVSSIVFHLMVHILLIVLLTGMDANSTFHAVIFRVRDCTSTV